jgi:replicative DNA helicase
MQQFNLMNEQILIDENLPHNFLAEKMILSCLIANSDTIEMTLQILPINAFYFKNHQEIYKSLIEMYESQVLIDTLTLTTFLQDKGLLETIGGLKVVVDLITQVPNVIYLEEYIRLVKDKFIRRSLIKLGYETINSGHVTNISLETILNDCETKLFNLTNEIKPQKVFSSAELLDTISFLN